MIAAFGSLLICSGYGNVMPVFDWLAAAYNGLVNAILSIVSGSAEAAEIVTEASIAVFLTILLLAAVIVTAKLAPKVFKIVMTVFVCVYAVGSAYSWHVSLCRFFGDMGNPAGAGELKGFYTVMLIVFAALLGAELIYKKITGNSLMGKLAALLKPTEKEVILSSACEGVNDVFRLIGWK